MKYLKIYEEFVYDHDIDYKTAELIDSESFFFGGINRFWKILRLKDGKYILTFEDRIEDYETQKELMERYIKKKDSTVVYGALDRLLKRMGSYKFQKEYLTKHPERIKELEPFGYNDKIRKEFPILVRGAEWGFFDLKN